ncbi:MAG: hypothetical protein Q8930_12645 [Bacillota bacterium]|nr:hypothetical protein [Bacillota bacterium]
MKKFFKKQPGLWISLFIVIIMTLSISTLVFQSGRLTFKIVNNSGDTGVLKGLDIAGLLQDNYFGVDFNIKGGKVKQSLMYYNNNSTYDENLNKYYINSSYFAFNDLITEDYIYEMNVSCPAKSYPGVKGSIVMSPRNGGKSKAVSFQSALTTYESGGNHIQTMAVVGDKLYFVIPTNENDRGKSGLYEVSKFSSDWENNEDAGSYRELASFDLEDGKVHVLGMTAVENKLCVILTENGKVVLRLYDSKNEEFTDYKEITPPFDINGGGEIYTRGIFVSGNKMMLCTYVYNSMVVDIFDISERISQIGSIRLDENSYMRSAGGADIKDMIYKNDMLYFILVNYAFSENYKPETSSMELRPDPDPYLDLYVYSGKGDLKYSGTVSTDIKDDNIWQLKDGPQADESYPNRKFVYVKLK